MSLQLKPIVDHFICESHSHLYIEHSERKPINQPKQPISSKLHSPQEISKCLIVPILYTRRLKERLDASDSMALLQHYESNPKSIVQLSPLNVVGETSNLSENVQLNLQKMINLLP